MTIRVLVVDDQPVVRAGVATMIGTQPDLEVIGEAADGLEAVAKAGQLRPDVIVMDIRMPQLNGIEATRRVVALTPVPPRVVLLTTFDLDEYVFDGLLAGASGFLLKHAPPEEILLAVRAAGPAMPLSLQRRCGGSSSTSSAAGRARPPTWISSPTGSVRSSPSSSAGSQTPLSRATWLSARPR